MYELIEYLVVMCSTVRTLKGRLGNNQPRKITLFFMMTWSYSTELLAL